MTKTQVVVSIALAIAVLIGVAIYSQSTRPITVHGAGHSWCDGFNWHLSHDGNGIHHIVVFDQPIAVGLQETYRAADRGFEFHSERTGKTIAVHYVSKHRIAICGKQFDLRENWVFGCRVSGDEPEVFPIEPTFGKSMSITEENVDDLDAYVCAGLKETSRNNAELRSLRFEKSKAGVEK